MTHSLHNIFEEIAEKLPDAEALQFSDDPPLTYKELNERANRLARALQKENGVKDGDCVIMFCPRSSEQVIIFLAILKCGATYVPLDTRWPVARVQDVVDEIKPRCIITTEPLQSSYDIKGSFSTRTACDDAALRLYETTNLGPTSNKDAYTMYSSGSTGKPKGSPLGHSGAFAWLPRIEAILQRADLVGKPRRVLHAISQGFDAHIWCFLNAWCFNASIHMVDDETLTDPRRLRDFITEHKVTDLTLTPATLLSLDLKEFLPNAPHLKTICSTGEACSPEVVQACAKNDVTLINAYGPTQGYFGFDTIVVTKDSMDAEGRVAIGNGESIPGVKGYILDESGDIIDEDGVLGEFCMASPHMSHGYVNRPLETEKDFCSIKVGPDEVRVLRTGDLMTRGTLPTGEAVFYCHGRIDLDAAVKINGVLVNPSEVETTLTRVEGIRDARVIVIQKGKGNKILVAYIQSSDPSLDEARIKRHLTQTLSKEAVPAAFIRIATMPLTDNGKVNKKKLAALYEVTERDLANMVRELLDLDEDIKPSEDTLTRLGANSLQITTLIHRIRDKYSVSIPVTLFYEEGFTIEAMKRFIRYGDKKIEESAYSPVLLAKGNPNLPPIFLTHDITGGASGTYRVLVNSLLKEIPEEQRPNIWALDAATLEDGATIEKIAKLYVDAMLHTQPADEYVLIGWSMGEIAWAAAQLLEKKGKKVTLMVVDTICPLVIQGLSLAQYAKRLLALAEHLNKLYGLDCKTLPSQQVLSKKLQADQIIMVINALKRDCSDKRVLQELDVCQKLLPASLAFTPGELKTRPHIIYCHTTYLEAQDAMPNSCDAIIPASLGWSEPQGDGGVELRNKFKGNHFDFIMQGGTGTVEGLAKYIAQRMPTAAHVPALKAAAPPPAAAPAEDSEMADIRAQLAKVMAMVDAKATHTRHAAGPGSATAPIQPSPPPQAAAAADDAQPVVATRQRRSLSSPGFFCPGSPENKKGKEIEVTTGGDSRAVRMERGMALFNKWDAALKEAELARKQTGRPPRPRTASEAETGSAPEQPLPGLH
ncbi:MAG: AMP-binding protein [Gammaproteobacteria bacterium]|nr:AMP-binding protein [Gammaproteobacteria bacterium]MCH9744392.1 AMP-binding protein [Gammaproteobacteria bacterium]